MPLASKPTRAADVYDVLKHEIRANLLAPGLQVPEPELALRLGVSRTTVREALIRLAADGLIELVPRRGMRVLPIRAEDMREIYQILTALESEAVSDLAQRRLSRSLLKPLSDATARMRQAVTNNAPEDWAEADDRFHDALLELHGNTRLQAIARALSDQAHRARMLTLRLRDIPAQSTQEHQRIVDAVLAGDSDRARNAYRAHRDRASQELLDILSKLQQL
ncbi:MAG: GntR family transcriptional regulator [Pseudomonadota bacterium]